MKWWRPSQNLKKVRLERVKNVGQREIFHTSLAKGGRKQEKKSQIKKASGDAEAGIRLDKYGVFS